LKSMKKMCPRKKEGSKSSTEKSTGYTRYLIIQEKKPSGAQPKHMVGN
jgi:hypothetical protein